MDRLTNTLPDCKYNSGVVCRPRSDECKRCGWNPDVLEKRLAKTKDILHKRNGGK